MLVYRALNVTVRFCRILCVSMAGDRQSLDRDELHVDLGCLRKCAKVAGI
jgi:hypothetical protein